MSKKEKTKSKKQLLSQIEEQTYQNSVHLCRIERRILHLHKEVAGVEKAGRRYLNPALLTEIDDDDCEPVMKKLSAVPGVSQ